MSRSDRVRAIGIVGSPTRALISAAAVVLPWSIRRRFYNWYFGWDIDPTARIGLTLFFAVEHVSIGPGATVGSFNVFRNLARVEIGADSHIGQWNWIARGADFSGAPDPAGVFRVGHDSSVTGRHYVDCSGGVLIGNYTTVAGLRTTIMTHGIDTERNQQEVVPVEIGDHCLISACCLIVPGVVIGDRVHVAGGAVVSGKLEEPALYAGVPARPKRPTHGAFFERTSGWVPFFANGGDPDRERR